MTTPPAAQLRGCPRLVRRPMGTLRQWPVLAGLAILLISCRELSIPQKAPRLDLENVRRITSDTYLYEYPVWSPDGTFIAAARNMDNQVDMLVLGLERAWEVVLINPVSLEVTPLYGPGALSIATWAPEGDRLAYVTDQTRDDQAGEVRFERYLTVRSIADGAETHYPCASCAYPMWLEEGMILVGVNLGPGPDGRPQYGTAKVDPGTGQMHSETPYSGISELSVIGPEGILLPIIDFDLASPTGEVLFMTTLAHDCSGIWTYRIGSDGPTPLIDNPEVDECDPALSLDGSRLLYTVKAPRQQLAATTIMLANADGTSPVTLLEPGGDPYQARYPIWSPDGTQFAFAYGLFQALGPSYSTLYIADVPAALQPGGRD